ncbi:MAG: hypothetical protein ABIH24_05910 [Verrucomicrobiota bacterium]
MPTPKQVDLKAIARELLTTGKADIFIGYQAASQPLTTAPLIMHAPKPLTPDAERDLARKVDALIFDDRCEINLVNYLHKFKDRRVAIVVKGCDSRSVVGLLQEKQVDRKNLIVIGAPCRGVIDRRQVGKLEMSRENMIYTACRECQVHNPVIADYLIGAPVPQPDLPEITPEMETIMKASPDCRWERFHKEMSKCILCYACRNLCPACYCKTCFADASKPKWVGRTDDPSDAMMFHLLRLMHLGGRCTGCGACVRGCPMNVDLRLYNDHLRSHVKQEYGFVAGMDPAAQPPLAMYEADDCNEFIR